jgi:hypothetical protein
MDRALASGAKGCAFESHRGYCIESQKLVLCCQRYDNPKHQVRIDNLNREKNYETHIFGFINK